MENRTRFLFLSVPGLFSLFALPPAQAVEPLGDKPREELLIEPEVARREISEAKFDTEDFEIGAFVGLMNIEDFGTSALYGARVAYHGTESLFLEAALGSTEANETSYEALSGDVQLLTDSERRLTYYNLSVGYNLLPGEVFLGGKAAYNSQFYLIAGIGSTRFAGDDAFTYNVGAGYRLLINDWLTLHLNARDHLFESDLLGETKTTHNFEMSGSLTFFF
ncbi:MAG: outer membrane beta-barrel domain-containing protein [Candidatus Thiodiazotropha sp.]